MMRGTGWSILVIFLTASLANPQSSTQQVQPILSQGVQSADVTAPYGSVGRRMANDRAERPG